MVENTTSSPNNVALFKIHIERNLTIEQLIISEPVSWKSCTGLWKAAVWWKYKHKLWFECVFCSFKHSLKFRVWRGTGNDLSSAACISFCCPWFPPYRQHLIWSTSKTKLNWRLYYWSLVYFILFWPIAQKHSCNADQLKWFSCLATWPLPPASAACNGAKIDFLDFI